MPMYQEIEDLVRRKSNLTEIEMARELRGPDAYQQKVNADCRWLVKEGRIERRGQGGIADPFRYHLGKRST